MKIPKAFRNLITEMLQYNARSGSCLYTRQLVPHLQRLQWYYMYILWTIYGEPRQRVKYVISEVSHNARTEENYSLIVLKTTCPM